MHQWNFSTRVIICLKYWSKIFQKSSEIWHQSILPPPKIPLHSTSFSESYLHLIYLLAWKFSLLIAHNVVLEKNVHKLKPDIWIELPYSPATPFLGTYPEKIKSLSLTGTFTPVFIAALFTIARHGSNLSVHQQSNG